MYNMSIKTSVINIRTVSKHMVDHGRAKRGDGERGKNASEASGVAQNHPTRQSRHAVREPNLYHFDQYFEDYTYTICDINI